jgi:hypothetical protein
MKSPERRTRAHLVPFALKRWHSPIFAFFPLKRGRVSINPCFSAGVNDVIICILTAYPVIPEDPISPKGIGGSSAIGGF